MINRITYIALYFFSASLLCSFLLFTAPASTAADADEIPIEIQNTRVVFDEGQPSSRVSVRNKSNIPYLVAVDIQQYCGAGQECPGTEDFMTSPGFKIINPGQTFPFRIVKLAEDLPVDRESLYLIHFRLLPSVADLSDKDLESARVSIAIVGTIKLFWRPGSLANTTGVLTVRDKLSAKCAENILEVNNPSPYWGTIGTLESSRQTLLKDGPLPMVAPFSSISIPLSFCPQTISVSFIAESGLLTSARSVTVQTDDAE